MEQVDVLIATPGTMLHAGYVQSLVATLEECTKRGITYKWLNGQGSLVHNAREATMTGSLNLNPNDRGPLGDNIKYNKVIWIDSDIEWKVKDFFKLYDSDKDIITGAYLLADGVTSTIGPIPTDINASGKELMKGEILRMTKPVKVRSAGFGFIGIKTGVFECIPRPWFQLLNNVIKNSYGMDLYISLGEDISWCIKAQDAGFDIWFDPKILVTHLKCNRVTW